jgi:hypothetical protein
MEPTLGAKDTITVGVEAFIDSASPNNEHGVVFEDDGSTGYFYALDLKKKENQIEDAIHIYNVEGVTDRDIPSEVHIIWSPDGQLASLIINRYPHAVFDFQGKKTYSRSCFPDSMTDWERLPWTDDIRKHFFTTKQT